jgi:hypothetical protein
MLEISMNENKVNRGQEAGIAHLLEKVLKVIRERTIQNYETLLINHRQHNATLDVWF